MSQSQARFASTITSSSLSDSCSTSPKTTTTHNADVNPSFNSNVDSSVSPRTNCQPRMSLSYITHQRRPALIPPDITLSPSDEQSVRMRTGYVSPYTDLDRYRHNIRSSFYVGVSPSIRCGSGRMAGSVRLRVESTETKKRDRDEDGDGKAEHQNKGKDGEENGCEHVYVHVKKRKRMASSADDIEMEELAEGTVEDEEMKDIKMKM